MGLGFRALGVWSLRFWCLAFRVVSLRKLRQQNEIKGADSSPGRKNLKRMQTLQPFKAPKAGLGFRGLGFRAWGLGVRA